jgi:maleate isomerase
VPCTTPITAAREAMKALGLERIALLTPYEQSINDMMRAHLIEHGFDVPAMGSFNNNDDHEVARITPGSVSDAVKTLADEGGIDGVFVSCGNLRIADRVEELEKDVGLPVVSSNTAMAWHCLRLAGDRRKLMGFGRLFGL